MPFMAWRFLSFILLFIFLLNQNVFSQTPAQTDVQALRAEIDALKADYDKRIQALEEKISALQGGGPTAAESQAQVPQTQAPQGQVPQTQLPLGQVPPPSAGLEGSQISNAKVFNPDIAVIGDFIGAAGSNEVDPSPTLEMHESEAAFQAILDPYARADFFFSFGEEGVGLEEGYITFPAIPGGLLFRAGKMRAAFGKVNTLHNHVLPWIDRPIVTRNLVAGEDGIDDAGFSLAKLIPNPWFFLEGTAQVYRGDSNDLFHSSKRGELSYVGHLRGYQDITDNTNIDLGISYAQGHNPAGFLEDQLGQFSTRLYGTDATLRWKPLSRAIYHSFVGRSEVIWSRRQQPGGLQSGKGFYVSGDYQFARRWFAGGRYDWSNIASAATQHDSGQSLVLTYWPSEFSQIRGQYRRTNYAVGMIANELLWQLQFSIGAHGAHPF
jgi:hypothetical protein